jgi:hypothetical protein
MPRDMLEHVYGRLPEVRHRSEMVEYWAEQHFDWKGGNGCPLRTASKLPAGLSTKRVKTD